MIEIRNVSKYFDQIKALDNISADIGEGQVFGLIGTNGAGKSTLMRTIAGVMRPNEGSIQIDGQEVYENPGVKSQIFYISDDQYFYSSGTPQEMMRFYKIYYPDFDIPRFEKLLGILDLDKNRKINTFSKGMKKQLSVLYGICSGTKYLLCDETFDGLDPVMRQAVKALFIKEIESRGLTPIIASHNLRELEDVCDHVGLLHKGGILFSKDLDEMKLGIHKLQCVLSPDCDYHVLLQGREQIQLLKEDRRGSLITLTLRGQAEDIESAFASLNPVFFELLPLTLEEIFISETEVHGYDFKNLIL